MNTVREDAKKETTVALITISDKDSGKNGNTHGKVVGDFLLNYSRPIKTIILL